MKESVFNYYITIDGKRYLYNTNNSGLLELSTDHFKDEEIEYLIEHKFYVQDEEDEVQTLEKETNDNILLGSKSLELTIALTNQCNFRCVYCYQDKNQEIMSEQTADSILKKIREILMTGNYEEIWIHYFGGEPLLNIPILRHLHKNIQQIAQENNVKYHTYLTTNGSMLTEELLSEMKFENIQLTFEGKEETHNSLRISERFHFQEEMELLRKILKASDARIILRMNACVQNKNEILDFYQFILKNFGYERFEIQLNRMIKYHEEDNFEMLTQQEYAKLFCKLQVLLGKITGKVQLPVPRKNPCKFTCGIAYSIRPDGYCNPCSGSAQCGNILFANIDISKRYNIKFRDECKQCICLPLCLGGCVVQHDLRVGCCTYAKFCLDEILENYIDTIREGVFK